MVNSTRATKVTKSGKTKATVTKKAKALPAKAGVKAQKKSDKINLDDMFHAAVAGNESFQISETDNYDIAIEHFNRVIRLLDAIIAIDPNYRDAINYKGMMLVGCGNNKDGVACFNAILKLNPTDKEALNNKGIALYGLGKDKEALKCVESAIALDSRYPDAYMNKAVILHGMNRLEEADKCVRKARALDIIVG